MQERAWPAYLGSERRAGTLSGPVAGDPVPVWRTVIARGVTGGPAVAEAVLALAQTDRHVALLDRTTGEVLWRRRLPFPIGAGPLLAGDRLYVAEQDTDGRVWALRLADGRTIWAARSGDVAAPLALDGDALYAASIGGVVRRLLEETGSLLWQTRVGGSVRAAPLPLPGALLVATATDSAFLLEAGDGRIRVRRSTPGSILAAPALGDGLVLAGTTDGRLLALDTGTLETRWAVELDGPVVGSVAVAAGLAWAVTAGGTLAAVPLRDPAAVRRVATGLVVRAGPTPLDGGAIVTGAGGEIIFVTSSGERGWTLRLGTPLAEAVVVDGSTLFATGQRGVVAAFR